jgi:hypothetical protein
MSKYQKLASHLSSLDGAEWNASFKDIEAVLGFSLPKSAYAYPAWWSNQTGEGHSQSLSWKSAGWRTSELDLAKQQIKFIRALRNEERFEIGKSSSLRDGLTIAAAKAGLAVFYGVSPDSIEITIRG